MWWVIAPMAFVLAVAAGCGNSTRAASSNAVHDGSIPSDLSTYAIKQWEGTYGTIDATLAEGVLTVEQWKKTEPANTSGLGPNTPDPALHVYAMVFRGDFTVIGPPRTDGKPSNATYHEGRVVFDEAGHDWSIRMWPLTSESAEAAGRGVAFGRSYDGE